ncbi:hypothetical protein LIER_27288 [Lithospermum erythrorhizon]|uniref:DUF4283 domain-containing protein n=1 Tax=Lithospermum erythrorhizon TaxID=34254 RepID=A0AAV3REI2_LITER
MAEVTGESLVFQAGGSGGGAVGKSGASIAGRPKVSGKAQSRVQHEKSRPLGEPHGDVSVPNRVDPLSQLPSRVGVDVHDVVPADPREGAKVRPKFSKVIKDNRLVGNGLKLEHYDLMENEDDVVLDENDEIPFVETWGYCLIGFFTGPFPGRQALNSLVNSWHVKCRIIPYAKGWTAFRFTSDEDRFNVFNGGPYLDFGKTLMLRLVDAGVIIGDDLFTSVPTWVLCHDVPLSVWSESGLMDVDVSKPPVLQFGVKLPGGKRYTQKVTYECYPDYCCDCKTFGHNVFKCPKKVKVVATPVVPSPVVPSGIPFAVPVPVVNPVPVIPTKVTRLKARVKNRNNAPHKASLPKPGNNIVIGSSSAENECVDMVTPPLNKGKGSKGVDKGKAIASQIAVFSPNSFEALNITGGTSETHVEDVSDVQMGDLVPSVLDNADHEDGVWQHVTRKGSTNGRGGDVSSSVSQCG